ncbi:MULTISPECIES: SH3 domain-containing protein [Legionella]|uniref:Putative endopeptidase p60 n=1 Tax=Legionella drozanskii LLAP-1 TaxID=1212489 RepID=A0A0W0TBY2_9GAMM|nr:MULTISPECIES: SH3 domain-containing protein [Legionella]KTC93083.1 putative endopeptidase p60 precursor [Legionella drozanskii LLAP-1]
MLNKKEILFSISLMLSSTVSFAIEVPIFDFPLNTYSQNSNDYLPKDSSDYSTPLLSEQYQKTQLQQFYNHYYASDAQGLSPWSEQMVRSVLPIVRTVELEVLEDFNNQNKAPNELHYSENFKEQNFIWWDKIKRNMALETLQASSFKEENKAIAVNNTFARALPNFAPDFFHISLPGQGFPFDNLQESAIWAGTPLYVFTQSRDKAWSLVLTPDAYFAWIKTSDLAYATPQFINQWQQAAKKNLAAITKTETSIVDTNNNFRFTGYIGAVFPLVQQEGQTISLLIPVKNEQNQAVIKTALTSAQAATLMPLVASKENLVKILKQLKNRPYGWGSTFFFNDCSQEMKSIFAPFGIWLPRNSGAQGKLNSAIDLSQMNVDERLKTLKSQGHPLMTLIYIGGHVMLYVGNKQLGNQEVEAISYQNVWGLAPKSRDKRYVIGQSAFLPLLKYFPENPDINSQANASYFKLVYLDNLQPKAESPQAFSKKFMSTNIEKPMDL